MADQTDLKIIEMLKRDSRTSLTELSSALNMSKTAVKKRIDKLIRNGVIVGFTIKTNRFFNTCNRRAIVGINIDKEKYFSVVDGLKRIPFVDELYSCTGSHDLYMFLDAPHGILDELGKKIRDIPGVKSVCFNVLQDRKG